MSSFYKNFEEVKTNLNEIQMPDKYRKVVQSHCIVCGKEIWGLTTRTYCRPTDGKTKSLCAIRAAMAQRAVKKAK